MEAKRIDFLDEDGILLYENVVSSEQLEDWYQRIKTFAHFRQMATADKDGDSDYGHAKMQQAYAWQANFNSPEIIKEINENPNIMSKVSDVDKQQPEGFELMEEIWDNITFKCNWNLEPIQQYINAFNHGDNTWGHTDWYEYTVIFYPNNHWDSQIMGGETLFFDEEFKFIRAAVACTPGNVVVFKGNIPHKAGLVSRETLHARLSVVYQCKGSI